MRPLFAVQYYVDCAQSWPDPPTGLTLCTTASPEEMTAMREPSQMLADWCVPMLCLVVLELLLRWRDAWAAARAQAGSKASVPTKGAISRGGYWAGFFACVLLFFGMAQFFTQRDGIDPSVPGMLAALLMLTCLAARRLRSQGLRAAWALPALVMPLLLFLGTLVPSLQRDWFLVWPEVSPRHFSLILFVYLWTLAFFIGLGLFNVTRRRGSRAG